VIPVMMMMMMAEVIIMKRGGRWLLPFLLAIERPDRCRAR